MGVRMAMNSYHPNTWLEVFILNSMLSYLLLEYKLNVTLLPCKIAETSNLAIQGHFSVETYLMNLKVLTIRKMESE